MTSKTSQLDLRIGEVFLKIGSVCTGKFKVKVYANVENSLSHIKTLNKNVCVLNFRHELLMIFQIFGKMFSFRSTEEQKLDKGTSFLAPWIVRKSHNVTSKVKFIIFKEFVPKISNPKSNWISMYIFYMA